MRKISRCLLYEFPFEQSSKSKFLPGNLPRNPTVRVGFFSLSFTIHSPKTFHNARFIDLDLDLDLELAGK